MEQAERSFGLIDIFYRDVTRIDSFIARHQTRKEEARLTLRTRITRLSKVLGQENEAVCCIIDDMSNKCFYADARCQEIDCLVDSCRLQRQGKRILKVRRVYVYPSRDPTQCN